MFVFLFVLDGVVVEGWYTGFVITCHCYCWFCWIVVTLLVSRFLPNQAKEFLDYLGELRLFLSTAEMWQRKDGEATFG